MNSVFITYNPGAYQEESTALRLQTIASLYDLAVEIPYRPNISDGNVHSITRERIGHAALVVALTLTPLQRQMQAELDAAISRKKKIAVIYDTSVGRNLNFRSYSNVIEQFVDFDNDDTDDALHAIAEFMKSETQDIANRKVVNQTLAVLGIGLGLLALHELTKSE